MTFSAVLLLCVLHITLRIPQVHAYSSRSITKLGSTGVRKRSLKKTEISPVQVIQSEVGGVAVVKLRQSLVGECDEATGVATGEVAKIFAYVFVDPDTQEPTCMLKREVDACYRRTLAIACDSETNTATIEAYVLDEDFNPIRNQVDNPRVGRCLPGQLDPLKRAIRITQTYECSLPVVDRGEPGTQPDEIKALCGTNYGMGCETDRGYYCVQNHGATCWFDQDVDLPPMGTCTKMGKDCTSSSECDTQGGEWCNSHFLKCAPTLAVGECCFGYYEDECGLDKVCGVDIRDLEQNYIVPNYRCAQGPCPKGWLCL